MSLEYEATIEPKGVEVSSVTTSCLNIVKQYHEGKIRKGDAIYEFTKTMPAGEIETAEPIGKTLKSYVSMLDDWDRERMRSGREEYQPEPEIQGSR